MTEYSDDEKYKKLQRDNEASWEALCKRCGACCGSVEGDPCEHLVQSKSGEYLCNVYENRFGTHKTISGETIRCVDIRNILSREWPGSQHCGYKNK